MTRHAWIITAALLAATAGLFQVDAAAQEPFSWQRVGGPFGGFLSGLTENPYTGDLWASQSSNGLYVSSDGGDTWTERAGSPFSASAFGFRADGTIFAGRYRSDNHGQSWLRTGFPDSTSARIFAFDDVTGNVIAGAYKGIYVSSDNGDTWTRTNSHSIEHLVVTDQGVILAITWANYEDHLIRSSDGGFSWEPIQLRSGQTPFALLMGPDDRLYLAISDDSGSYRRTRLYISSDLGDTWELVGDLRWPCFYPRSLLGFDATGRLFMASDEGIYRVPADLSTCTTLFEDFERKHAASGSSRYKSLRATMMDTRGRLFVTSGFGGPYRSRDGGETWDYLTKTGIPAANVWSVFVEEQTGIIWAGTSKDGLFYSEDQGQTWNRQWGFESKNIIDITAGATPDELWAATPYDGLFLSRDAGATWEYVPHDVFDNIYNLQYAPASQTLFAHYPVYDIYYTQDRGQTWHPMNVPINNRIDPPLFAMTVTDEEEVYAAVLEPLEKTFVIHQTRDLGQTWEALNADFPGLNVNDAYWGVRLLVDSADTLWATIRTTVYYSADQGASWHRAADIPDADVFYSLIESPDGALWIGHDEGVHRSTDRGRTWHAISDGLTHRFVNSLAWDPHTGAMVAGTLTGGVFRGRAQTPTSITEPQETPGPAPDIPLFNYPNPFTDATTIAFDLPQAGRVRLALYDVLGREVMRLFDQPLPQGRHRVSIDGKHLPPGVYFYRLDTPSGTVTNQMTHIR